MGFSLVNGDCQTYLFRFYKYLDLSCFISGALSALGSVASMGAIIAMGSSAPLIMGAIAGGTSALARFGARKAAMKNVRRGPISMSLVWDGVHFPGLMVPRHLHQS